MEMIKKVKEWLGESLERSRARREARRKVKISEASLKAVQVTEFGGDIYVSYYGVPVVSKEDLNVDFDITDVLGDSREAFVEYMMKNGEK